MNRWVATTLRASALSAAVGLLVAVVPRPLSGQADSVIMRQADLLDAAGVETPKPNQGSNVTLVYVCAATLFCEGPDAAPALETRTPKDSVGLIGGNTRVIVGYRYNDGSSSGDAPVAAGTATRAVIWIAVMAVLIVGGFLIASAAT